MKHIIVIETVDPIGISEIDTIRDAVDALAEKETRQTCFTTMIANQPSATRGVYRLYHLDQSQSPDELQAAK